MNKLNCRECKTEFEETAEIFAGICPACGKKQKSDIQIFQTLKILSFSFALIALSFFIPLLMTRETSHGYYEMLGSKGRPMLITGNGILKFMIVIVILSIIFSILGFWFGWKQREKESIYQNDELFI